MSPAGFRQGHAKPLCLLLLLVLSCACQSPFLTLPGGKLQGEVKQVDSMAFASQYTLLQLETHPQKPYSVWLRVTVINDQLYIDAAAHRRWHQYLQENPHVRVKIAGLIYPCLATEVTAPEIKQHFLSDRRVYRLDPS